jgi:23S rRNA (uracil1939-C5)-methyltransferase
MLQVRVLRLAAGGDGVAKLPDGRTVFVPRTAPGDLAELTAVQSAKRFARARLARLVEFSRDRVDPPCPHYTRDECGGCQLQHVGYSAQLEARRSIVGEALRRLARVQVPDPTIEPAEAVFGYRTKLTLAARGGRIGLRKYGRADAIFDLERCHITASPLNQLWHSVRAARRLLPLGLDQLVLRLDQAGERHLLTRVTGGRRLSAAEDLARSLTDAGTHASVWWQPDEGPPQLVAGHRGTTPPAGVFEQIHPAMAQRARAFAVERLGAVEGALVWDLYGGVGDTTALLARAGARVHSVELDPRAVAYAERTGVSAARHAGRAESLVGTLPDPELVIVNPPRTGMDARVPATLLDRRPRRIVYISCDPATLARDVGRLAAEYRLVEARCFDLFPQTAHVETVAVLERG